MTLPDDTSIPFPFSSPTTWDQQRLKGLSGQDYIWPLDPRFGVVSFDITPPPIRSKKSIKSGNKKPRVKDVGQDLTIAKVSYEVTQLGWPSWVANVYRLISEVIDGPWRLSHPEIDTFDCRLFKVKAYVKLDDKSGGLVKASCELTELDPDEQANLGKSFGVKAVGAAEQQYNLTAAAYAAFEAQQKQFIQERAEAEDAQRRADALRKPGVLVAKRLPVEKAIAFGKINL